VKEGATREAASEHGHRDADAAPGAEDLGARVLELQRSAGNAVVGRYLRELQRQPAAAPAATQWGRAYGTRKSYFGHTYEAYKAAIPALTPASETAGTARSGGLTRAQLFHVFTDLAADAAANPEVMKKADRYLAELNQAFDLMGIDTLEAQSAFLAHAFVESDQFRRLTEATAGQERYREYPTDEERLDVGGLEKLYKPGTKNRRTIDPIGDWSFIGRGPLQVTHRANYVQTLAYLEKQAEAEEAAGRKDRAVRLRETVDAVKADPKQASNPRHTFLFSAAYMRMAGGDVRSAKKSAKTFGGKGPESVWMTGGHTDPQATKKAAAWGRALEALGGS
jgi:predicted chitinase